MPIDVKSLAVGSLAVLVGLAVASVLFGPNGFVRTFAGNKASARL